MSPRFDIQPIARGHDRRSFKSGSAELDEYLKSQASQDCRKGVSAVFVATEVGRNRVIGFYTLSACHIRLSALPAEIGRKLPKYPIVPATLLGRLAVDESQHGKNLGRLLLMDALSRACSATSDVASYAVVVDAKNEEAAEFYEHYDFVRFEDQELRLFLPMATIKQLGEGA